MTHDCGGSLGNVCRRCLDFGICKYEFDDDVKPSGKPSPNNNHLQATESQEQQQTELSLWLFDFCMLQVATTGTTADVCTQFVCKNRILYLNQYWMCNE